MNEFSAAGQYRKKPVVIDAFRLTTASDLPPWFSEAMKSGRAWYQGGESPFMTIATLEGEMRANLGDWIILGIAGEIYPCKPEIFAATYEAVDV